MVVEELRINPKIRRLVCSYSDKEVDAEGYLAAQGDFTEPVGPSYWERANYIRTEPA